MRGRKKNSRKYHSSHVSWISVNTKRRKQNGNFFQAIFSFFLFSSIYLILEKNTQHERKFPSEKFFFSLLSFVLLIENKVIYHFLFISEHFFIYFYFSFMYLRLHRPVQEIWRRKKLYKIFISFFLYFFILFNVFRLFKKDFEQLNVCFLFEFFNWVWRELVRCP